MTALRPDLRPQEAAGADETVDPRVAATGGHRRTFGDAKSNYEWPGMMAQPDWRRTNVHAHTEGYWCAHCAQGFKSPHAVYTHMDKAHPQIIGARIAALRQRRAQANG